jgi:anti-sigma factor (TIGR02949 family)
MITNCLEVQENLSAWLDGELAPEVMTQVERHLEGCAGCRRELALFTALDQALGSLTAPVPAGLPEKVRARLRLPSRRRWQTLALAASLVLGIYLGGTVARDFYAQPLTQAQVQTGLSTEVASLEAFHDFPQGSMGMILASYQEDEGNGSCK